MDNQSLAHTSWNCKYHIVFAPKYRRREIFGKLRTDIGKILRMLCQRKEIEIIEAECCIDHVHMLVKIPPKHSSCTYASKDTTKTKTQRVIYNRLPKR